MKKQTAAAVLAVSVLAGGGAALTSPAFAADTTSSTSATDRAASRLTAIKDALKGLVTDGTLTQAQADEVASTLAEKAPGPPRGHGPGRGLHLAALEELGITAAEVRAAVEAGTTLAELAEQQGVSSEQVVDALVAAQQERLKAAVADGRLTQAEADEKAADLETRITESLDDPIRPGRGHGHHHHRA